LRLKKAPLITIAITCFNAEKTIERAILSALNQDWPNFEVIIIDDASNDSSKEIIKKYESKIKNLQFYNQKINNGCAKARNILISKAKGEFIAFFDDDDFSHSDRLSLQFEHLISYEKKVSTKLIACFASGERIYPNSYKKSLSAVGANGLPPIGLQMANYLLFNERINRIDYGAGAPTCSLLARTSIFRDLGGFDTKIRRQEDVDFAIKFAMRGGHFIGIKNPVIEQYVSFSNDKSALIEYKSSLCILNKYCNYLKYKGVYKYMQLWMMLKFFHLSNNDFKALFLLIKIFLLYPLRTVRHFARSGLKRLFHEQLINSSPKRIIIKKKCVKFLNPIINIF